MKNHDTPEKTYDLERLIFFSDGVFAIAITLLVIEMHPPREWDGTVGALVDALSGNLICYVISFSALAAFWTAHRFIFRHVQRFTEPVSLFNLLFLLAMSLVPFANAMLLEYVQKPVAIYAYVGLVIAASTIVSLLWAYVALLTSSIDPRIGKLFRWLVFARLLLMPPILSFSSIWLGRHFGPWVAVAATATIAIIAGRFGVKPLPASPEVKEI